MEKSHSSIANRKWVFGKSKYYVYTMCVSSHKVHVLLDICLYLLWRAINGKKSELWFAFTDLLLALWAGEIRAEPSKIFISHQVIIISWIYHPHIFLIIPLSHPSPPSIHLSRDLRDNRISVIEDEAFQGASSLVEL